MNIDAYLREISALYSELSINLSCTIYGYYAWNV